MMMNFVIQRAQIIPIFNYQFPKLKPYALRFLIFFQILHLTLLLKFHSKLPNSKLPHLCFN
jgi:hypothetical protein